MCTRFVYNGIDKIVGFNFDIDLSVWDHTVITERNRETLLMYYFLEMNNEEIAKKQNISRSGVFQNRHNSLALMRKLLKEKR